jgi:hypothetical protein
MKANVRKDFCPECFTGEQTWVVRGHNGDCWTCSRDFNTALRYAIGRAHQQPGTGDQVQTQKRK